MSGGAETEEARQTAVLDWLRAPASHRVATPVDHVETHISHIVLAGDRAYKLKKARDLGFLDFRTVARREAACRAEIAVNRAAGALYIGVRAIRRADDGGFAFAQRNAEAPDAVDWVVEMRRFDRRLEFDRLLERGALGPGEMRALADRIAAAHRDAPVATGSDGAERMRALIADVAGALASLDGAAAWADAARAAAAPLAAHFDARRADGFVRRCHGDLHLANIVLLDGAPTPFDAIEFDDAIATIDTAYDLAFPLADLIARGAPALANPLLNRYLAVTGDYAALAALDLHLSLRVAIRAMTARLKAPDGPAAAARLALARALLAGRPAPRVIAVGGLSGSGKSTLARAVAARAEAFPPIGAIWISSDPARKRLHGAAPETRLPPAAYGPGTSAEVYAQMRADASAALAAGRSVVLDAVFHDPMERQAAEALAAEAGSAFEGVWLDAPQALRAARVDARRGDASDADGRVVAAQADLDLSAVEWARRSAEDDLTPLVAALAPAAS